MPVEQAVAASQAAPNLPIVPYILIFLIFYFLVIRPKSKKDKVLKKLREDLKKNDHVVTAGGMHGTVVMPKEKTVVIRVDDNVKLEFDKESISTVVKSKSS